MDEYSPTTTGWSTSLGYVCTSYCYYNYIVGGYGCFGKNAWAKKTYTGLPGHNKVEIKWTAYFVDSWDGSTGDGGGNYDSYILKVDETQRYQKFYEKGSIYVYNYCGASSYADYWTSATTGNFTHNSTNITLYFTSTLNQDSYDESFGFRDIVIRVDVICTPACATCYGNSISECYSCKNGWYLNGTTCVTDCGNYYWNNPSGNVCTGNLFLLLRILIYFDFFLGCHNTCVDCDADGSTKCNKCVNSYLNLPPTGSCTASCNDGYYKVGSPTWQCKQCWQGSGPDYYSCKTCTAGNRADCKSCGSPAYLHPRTGGECVKTCPVGFWGDSSTRTCEPCHSSTVGPYYSCATCWGGADSHCSSCNPGKYLHPNTGGQCLNPCPDGFWGNNSTNKCMPCWNQTTVSGNTTYYACTTCIAGTYTDCKSCSYPAFLYPYNGGDCRAPCPDGFWGSIGPPRLCLPCYSSGVSPYTCKTCNGGTNSHCLTCYTGTFLYGGQCINPCPAGYWGDTSTNTCKLCHNSASTPYTCKTCIGPANYECASCDSPRFLYSGKCLDSCPIGYWGDTSTNACKPCYTSTSSTSPFSCRSCDNTGSSHCLSCTANSYLYPNTHGQCLASCPAGYWGDTTTWKCQPCYSNPSGDPVRKACATCFGPSATSCLTCQTGTYYFSVDKTCLSTCPPGYYANGLSNPNNLCVQCYQNNPPSSPDGTCLTCSGPNSNECLSCGSYQYLDSTPVGKCVDACPIGWYANPTTNTCQKCYQAPDSSSTNQSCYTCTGTTSKDCTACLPGTFLYQEDQTCLYNCPDGWWGYLPTLTCKICYQYDPAFPTVFTCATCNAGNSNNCLSCNTPYFWDSTTGTCVETCPDSYWGDSGSNTCKPCFSTASSSAIMKTCKTCSGGSSTNCTSCKSGNYLYTNNTCLGGCPGGYYPDSVTISCKICFQSSTSSSVPNTCATCTGPSSNQCITCLSSFYLDPLTNTCIKPCPAGYYADTPTQQCKQCFQAASSTSSPRNCLTCSGALATNCLSCSSGEYLLPSTSSCLSSCPAGTYARTDINWCGNCYQAPSDDVIEKSCATCNGWKPTNCLTCPSQTYYYPQNSTCLSSCPSGTYYDTNSQSCQECYQTDSNYFGCLTCAGPMYTQCTSCADDLFYFEQNGTCGSICPCGSGYFYNSTTKQCGTCYPGCQYCTSPSSQDCYYSDIYDYDCLLGEFDGKNQTQSFSMLVQGVGYSAYGLSLANVILSGASTMSAPIVFTYSGILGLYQFLNVDYSSNALLFFQMFFSFNGGNDFPNYFSSSDSKYWNSDSRIEGNNKFHLFRISYLFLKNFGGKLSLLLTLVVSVPIFAIAAVLLANAGVREKYLNMFNAVRTFIQWNLILTVFLSSFVQMILSLCLQLHFLDKPIAWYDIFSTSICLLATIAAASLTIALYLYTRIKNVNTCHPNLCKKTKILTNQEDFTKDPDPKSKSQYWALASCLRSLVLVSFVSTLSNYPLIQCSTALGTNVIFLVGILKWRFFDRKPKDAIIKACEGLNAIIPSLFLVHSIYEYLGVKLDQQTKLNIGWGIIVLVTTVLVLSLVYQIMEMCYILKRIGTPLLNKLKVFLEYSIGKDIWKRPPKKKVPPVQEMIQLKPDTLEAESRPQKHKFRDATVNNSFHEDVSKTMFDEGSLSISARDNILLDHSEIMTLKRSANVEDVMTQRINK